MSQHYYLISSLTTPQFGSPPPLSFSEFAAYSARAIGREADFIPMISLLPPLQVPRSLPGLLVRFWERETCFRNELARQRAAHLGGEGERSVRQARSIPAETGLKALAQQLVKLDDPLDAEFALERSRWEWLGSETALDAFGTDALAAYGVKILILERLARFREEVGAAEYERVYEAVLAAAARDGVA